MLLLVLGDALGHFLEHAGEGAERQALREARDEELLAIAHEVEGFVHARLHALGGPVGLVDGITVKTAHERDLPAVLVDELRQVVGLEQAALPDVDAHVDLDRLLARFSRDDAAPGDLGVAVDLGTTTVAAYLIDLCAGRLLAHGGEANPQASFGADVISRIQACREGKLAELQRAAAGCVRDRAAALCVRAGADAARITRWAVAGNTVMQHILCGTSPESIGAYPFTPQLLFGDARAVPGLGARVAFCPCVSGYVGGDITAGFLACGIDELTTSGAGAGHREGASRTVLFADLGTNGEMAIAAGGELVCCATATGPDFEGANISCGMRARAGAASACRFEGGAFAVEVIGAGAPVGVCGSGLIDAPAACLKAGVVDETGRVLLPDELPPERAPRGAA